MAGLSPALVAIGIQALVMAIIVFSYTFIGGLVLGYEFASMGITDNDIIYKELAKMTEITPETQYVFAVIASVVCGVVFFFWYRRVTKYEIKIRLNSVFKFKKIGLFISLGIGCQLLLSGIMNIIQPFLEELFKEYSSVMETLFSGKLGLVILYTVIIAPIVEELIFRGLMLKLTQRSVSFMAANFMQALVFGIYHGNLIQGTYAFGLGFLLGLLARKFKSIIAPILLHIIVNGSAFLIGFLPSHQLVYFGMIILGGVSVVFSYIKLIAEAEDIADYHRPLDNNYFL